MSEAPSSRIDFSALDVESFDRQILNEARLVWADRVRTEYQSIQITARFLTEALAAAEPLDVIRAATEAVEEETRHTELCRSMCEALGGAPPALASVAQPIADLGSMTPRERVIASAVSLFLVAEAFSVGYILDLEARADHPVTKAVLQSIASDEEGHEAFGPALLERHLASVSSQERATWAVFAKRLVQPFLDRAEKCLAAIPEEQRTLDHWAEPDRAKLGVLGEVRIALLTQKTFRDTLQPAMVKLGLG